MAVPHPLRTRPIVSAVVCLAAAVVLFHVFGNATRGYIDTRSLFVWWGRQWMDAHSEAQHGPLVVLIAVWLWWRNLRHGRTRLDAEPSATRPEPLFDWPAPLALGGGLGLHVFGYAVQQTRLSIVALLLFVWGVLRLAGGRRWSRAALFPLAFVLLAVPMGFLEDVGFYLRLGVSKTAESVARAAGIGIVRNGTQLFSPDGKFQYDVAAACSGVRSLVALFALACLIGYLNVRSGWQRALVALLTFPFAFVANAARILAIVWAGEKWGHTAGARLHDASGVLVFLIVLGLLLLCVRWMSGRATPPVPGLADLATQTGAPTRVAPRTAAMCLAAVALGVGLSAAAIRQIDRRPSVANAGVALAENGRDPAPLPEDVGADWFPQRVEVTAVEREILPPDTGYSRKNYLSLSDRAHQVFVSIVLSGKDRTSIHRPELCIIGQGWTVSERTTYTFDLGGEPLPVTLLRVEREMPGRNGELVKVRTFLAYWFAHPGGVVASHRAMLFRNAFDRVRHLRADRWAYVVAQSVIVGDEAAALEHMRAVLAEVWPKVRRTDAAENRQ